MVRQAPVICVMAPPIHLGAWSMALMLMERARVCVVKAFLNVYCLICQDSVFGMDSGTINHEKST